MTPTHIEVRRCEGGCHQTGHNCVALTTLEKKVPVMFGKCGLNVGKCEKECAHVTVEEHTACGCACDLRHEECDSVTHNYLPELCVCECRNTRDKRDCLDQGRAWSEKSCSCGCPLALVTQCPQGFIYDNESCSCKTDLETFNRATLGKIIEKEIKEEDDVLSWEMIVMIILVSIIILLSLITMMLVIQLKTHKIKLKSNHSLVPSTLSGQYFPCSDPCADLERRKKTFPSLTDSEGDHLTDSSLCSEEKSEWNEGSEGSRESFTMIHKNKNMSDNCQYPLNQTEQGLESVRLNRNLAFRRGSGTIPSTCNTVKIVYRNGEKTMELNCQMEPGKNDQLNIITNPLVYSM